MADTEKGGLSSVDPMADFSQKIRQQNVESQQVLDAHRKRLMDLISSRQQMPFDPAMMGLAAGLLAPTKTGGFGESLGYGMSNYAAEAEKQFRRQQEEAKLAYELEVAAQEQKRKMMGQEFFGRLTERRKPRPAEAPAAEAPVAVSTTAPAPATIEAAPRAEPVAEAPKTVTEAAPKAIAGKAPVPVSAAAVPADQVLAQVNKNDKQIKDLLVKIESSGSDAFSDVTNEEIAALGMYAPEYANMIKDYRDAVNKGTTLDVSRLNAFVAASKLELDKVQEMRAQAELRLKEKESNLREREVEAKELSIENNLPGVGSVKLPKSFWDDLGKAEKAGDFGKILDLYKSKNLPINTIVGSDGKLRFMTPSELEIKVEKEKARFTQTPIKVQIPEYGVGTFEMTPVEYSDYRDARRSGNPDVLQHWFNGSQFQGVVIPGSTIGTKFNSPELTNPKPAAKAPAKAPADKAIVPQAVTTAEPKADSSVAAARTTAARVPTGRILSAEELERQLKEEQLARDIELAKQKEKAQTEEVAKRKRAEEETKADVELGTNIMKEGTNAQNIRIIAKDLRSIATSNPKIFNVMQDTTVSDALARTIQSGIITPWGSVSIDPKDLYVAVDNFASKKPGITKADRDAYSLFLRNIAQLTILERRMSRGEGQISDKETVLFAQVNVLPSDSALAVRLKAELIEERANVTEKVGDAFYKYKKKTNGSYEDFTHSDEYKAIKKGYEDRLDRIRDSNAKLLGGVSTQSQTTPQTTLPPAALKQLAEGQVTRFANGQEWTLRGGKPIRIK